MKNMKAIMFPLFAAAVTCAASGEVFYWIGDGPGEYTWGSFGDPANWVIGTDAKGTNPQNLTPGASDEIYIGGAGVSPDNARWYFDLDGSSYALKCINSPRLDWKRRYLSVTNGTLEFTESFSNRWFDVNVYDGGKFKVADGSYSLFGDSNTRNTFKVHDGGELELRGEIVIYNYDTTVFPGGKLVFAPSGFSFQSNNNNAPAHRGQGLYNEGEMEFPAGFTLEGTSKWADPVDIRICQGAGVMTMGGNVTRDKRVEVRGELHFSLTGGVFRAVNDVSFVNLKTVETAPGTTAELCVTEDFTLDGRPFVFGENTSIVKTGSGRLELAALPASLSVQAGVFSPEVPSTLPGVTFSPGTTLEFRVPGFEIASLPNSSEMNFTVDTSNLGPGATLVRSDDTSLLETIAAKIAPSLPSGMKTLIEDGELRLDVDAANSFSSDGELSLSDDSGWKGDSVPAGADVFITGSSTVALIGPSTPAFKSITVTGGAVLKVAPGTVLPEISTLYSAKVLFEAGAESVFTNGFVSRAAANELPVIEIPSDAAVNVGEGFVFKNVDLHLFGQLTATNAVVFGGAAAGETTFFAMTWDGATFRMDGRGHACYRRLVMPEDGGRVEVVRDILMRNVTMLPDNDARWGNSDSFSALQIGYNNPEDAPFTVVVDGCYIELGYEVNRLGGGVTVKCVNGGGVFKPKGYAHPGFHGTSRFSGGSRIVLEDGSYMRFSKTTARQDGEVVKSLLFEPRTDNFKQLIVRDGSSFCAHETYGNGRAVAVIEDSFWDVPTLPEPNKDFPDITDTRVWMTDIFDGFRSVKIPEDSSLYLRATNDLWGLEWDRDVLLADVPLTGGGSLVMTNAASGNPFRATVVCSSNTATGVATAYPDVCGDDSTLLFNDGANWAGTVIANGHVALTNLLDGSAARVSFNALVLAGDFPVRVWADENDMVDISAASLTGSGRIKPVAMDGRVFVPGESFRFGTYPAGAAYPERTGKDWVLFATETDDPDKVMLNLRYSPRGLVINFR